MAGGTGGNLGGPGAPGGAGHAGHAGQPGGTNSDGGGGGGGGGGAGGGIGVTGGAGGVGGGTGGGAGGVGGTSASPNGTAGSAGTGAGGGGGGGGGYLGYIGAGTSSLMLTNLTFDGGSGGAGGASGGSDNSGGGGGGGAGGYGAVVTGPTVPVDTMVQGGAGGRGGGSASSAVGNGGDGGVGLLSTAANATITIETITAGSKTSVGTIGGGAGGAAGTGSLGGVGGAGGTGVAVQGSGGTVSNMGGAITGGTGGAGNQTVGLTGAGGSGIVVSGSGGTVSNTGTVTGGTGGSTTGIGHGGAGGAGVDFAANGASLINQSIGRITGGTGGSAATVGFGAGGAGVTFAAGGTVSNAGAIFGGSASSTGGSANSTGDGAGGIGVDVLGGAGSVTNQMTGVIVGGDAGGAQAGNVGGDGIVFASGGTLTNAGTIEGGASTAAGLKGSAGVMGADLTIIDTGVIYTGSGGAGGGLGDAITFTGGANTLALGMGTAPQGLGALVGALDIQGGTLMFDQNAGSNLPTDVTVSDATPIIGAGAVIKADTGTLTVASSGTYIGGTTIEAGTLDLDAIQAAGTGAIKFAPTTGTATLALEQVAQPVNGATFGNTLANFGASDELDLKGLAYSASSPGAQYNPATGKLMVTENGETEDFTLSGVSTGETFFASSDSNGGTEITATVCFVTGTAIRTARGEVSVEALEVGDLAVTASGALRPIRWIGQRTIDCAAHPVPSEVWPVRVLAGAFGADLPERDLYLSPGHPVLVGSGPNERLVPIMCLINGTSIARTPVAEITYWHVELDAHDILLAEGLPAESFLDYGNRPWFADGADHALLHPDFVAPGLAGRCRPVATDGPQVETERRRIDTLFALRLAGQCAWPTGADDGDDAWMIFG